MSRAQELAPDRGKHFSFFRTLTVGIGISPILLTEPRDIVTRFALVDYNHRWGISPRPETGVHFSAFWAQPYSVRLTPARVCGYQTAVCQSSSSGIRSAKARGPSVSRVLRGHWHKAR